MIVVRHGATFTDQADTDPFNFDNIAAQRNLNDKGKALATAFGGVSRARIGIPVGKVYTSKFNRAYETAVLAGFKDIEKTADLTEGGLVVSPNENNRRAEAFRKLLGAAPKAGTNTVLITHKPNIVDALGKDWFDVKEGEASIFRPENGSYSLSRACRWTNGRASRRRDKSSKTTIGGSGMSALGQKRTLRYNCTLKLISLRPRELTS